LQHDDERAFASTDGEGGYGVGADLADLAVDDHLGFAVFLAGLVLDGDWGKFGYFLLGLLGEGEGGRR
jgi:hypothetical protein